MNCELRLARHLDFVVRTLDLEELRDALTDLGIMLSDEAFDELVLSVT